MQKEFIVERIMLKNGYKVVSLRSGSDFKIIRFPRFVYLYQGQPLIFKKENGVLHVYSRIENEIIKILPPYRRKVEHKIAGLKLTFEIEEMKNNKQFEEVKKLEQFHYLPVDTYGRRAVLLLRVAEENANIVKELLPEYVGFVMFTSTFKYVRARYLATGEIANDPSRFVRLARIVIHPSIRSTGVGSLLVKYGIEYLKERWYEKGKLPYYCETIAAMAEYHPFFVKAGFTFVGYTEADGPTIESILRVKKKKKIRTSFEKLPAIKRRPRPYFIYPLRGELVSDYFPEPKYKGNRILKDIPKPGNIIIKDLSFSYKYSVDYSTRVAEIEFAFGVSPAGELPIVKNFSLTIPSGSITVIHGHSGSGKSTLLKLLIGKLKPDSGKIIFPENAKIFFADGFERFNEPNKPIIDLVGRNLEEAMFILNMVGLSEAYNYITPPSALSTGQYYRYILAKAIDSRSNIWILDNFCDNLDLIQTAVISHRLRKLARKYGITVIVATTKGELINRMLDPDIIISKMMMETKIERNRFTGF